MVYELKIIDAAAQVKILEDAGEKAPYLKAKGGHFSNNPGLHWAIDEVAGSYLFWSPRLPMDSRYFYYFFQSGRMYSLVMDSESSPVVRVLDQKSDFDSPLLRKSISSAFAAHGVYGMPGRPGLKVLFEDEGAE